MDLKAGLADQSVSFAAWTTATGAPVTVTKDTAGLSLWYRRGVAGLKVPLTLVTTPALNNLATLDAAHTDAGLLVIEGAEHRFDLPDAAIAAGVLTISWGGSATGITIDGGTANLIGQANTATDVLHVFGTAQTAAPGANGGLLIAGSNAATTFAALTVTNAATLGTLSVTGLASFGAGVQIDNAAGIGLDINGTTFGMTVDGSAGPGVHIGGTTIGLDIDASNGIGVDIDGTTGGMTVTGSAGPGVVFATTFASSYAMHLDAPTDSGIGLFAAGLTGIYAAGAGFGDGMVLTAGTAGSGLVIQGGDAGGPGVDIIVGESGHGVQIRGGTVNGDGVRIESLADGDGLKLISAGAGKFGLAGTVETITAAVAAQAIRDAMKLAPTAGDPAAGSVDKHLDDASAAADPLLNPVPGTYAAGTAGEAIGRITAARMAVLTDWIDAGRLDLLLDAIKLRTDLIVSAAITILPGPATGLVTVYHGDSYAAAQAREISWSLPVATNPDLTTAESVTLTVYALGDDTAVIATAGTVAGAGTANQAVAVALTAAQTELLAAGYKTYYSVLRAAYPDTNVVTLQEDEWIVLPAGAAAR